MEPQPPVRRYERERPGELVHLDASRLAYVEVLSDQRGLTAVAFFERARRWFRKRQISIERVMTDNGSCYVSRRFRNACQHHGIRHLRTRAYRTSNQRTRALPKWIRYYNEDRPHRSLGMLTPSLRAQRAA
jgi:transposase InsO family protein